MLFHVAVIHSFHFIVKVLLKERMEAVRHVASFHSLSILHVSLTVEFQSVDGMEVYLTSLILMGMWIPQAL